MILQENISNTSFGFILKSVPYHYGALSIIGIPRGRTSLYGTNLIGNLLAS